MEILEEFFEKVDFEKKSGSKKFAKDIKLFDTLMVILKEFLKKLILKKSADDKKIPGVK